MGKIDKLRGYGVEPRYYMNMRLIYFSSVLVLMMGAIIAVPAQESNALLSATSNSTLNNNSTLPVAPAQNDTSSGSAVLQDASANSSNASSSLVAGSASETAVAASSVQAASLLEGVFKIGEGVSGASPLLIKDEDAPPYQIGIPIKPMRDTGKMFFVCDIV